MREKEAKDILQLYIDRLPTEAENADGEILSGWHRHVGERYTGDLEHPLNGSSAPQDNDSFYFIAYTLPPGVSMDAMTEEQQDEYGGLWGVEKSGRVFMPEL
jgi:hypothetical protein